MNHIYPLLIALGQVGLFLAFVFWYEKKVWLPRSRIIILVALVAVFYISNFHLFVK